MILALILASLPAIECPNWLPGTTEILPPGVALSPEQQVKNLMRCYCEIVKPLEDQCIRQRMSPRLCRQRTERWLREEVFSRLSNTGQTVLPAPTRGRIISIEP